MPRQIDPVWGKEINPVPGKVFRALCPGSCGELVQGQLGGVDFLVTCPVDLFASATFQPAPQGEKELKGAGWKTVAALEHFLRAQGYRGGWRLEVENPLPVGKGMGSSTADIAAALGAAALALGLSPWPVEDIAQSALAVEPSDGLMFPGIVLFDHRRGRWREDLGPPPPFEILVFDQGGQVDTVSFNQRPDFQERVQAKSRLVAEALELVRTGLKERDPVAIGAGATLSALANQEMLPKENLPQAIGLAREVQAVGINVAHSGSVIGVLLDPRQGDGEEIARYLRPRFPGMFLGRFQIIGGGLRLPPAIPRTAVTVDKTGPIA